MMKYNLKINIMIMKTRLFSKQIEFPNDDPHIHIQENSSVEFYFRWNSYVKFI